MRDKTEILIRAQAATLLDSRIAQNVNAQKVDLVEWIFERITVDPGSKILELCCGTGSQTLRMLDLVEEMGQVVALDISPEALEKLQAKVKAEWQSRLILVEADMEQLPRVLEQNGLEPSTFDLAFCAYGLYYNANATQTLQETKYLLQPGGRIVIVGPFGANNGPIFDLLAQGGVTIPTYVKYTSAEFMFKEVIPWVTQHFETVTINTLVNPVVWKKAENVLGYWRNTTFYDREKEKKIETLLNINFNKYPNFVNEKWVMMIEAANART
jgi:ubiquinone/menaquinone biosynthesis C-methylase UbiE